VVEHEVIYGRPINLKPMSLRAVVKLKVGDKVYVWWAKDGDLYDVRVDEVVTIREASRFERFASSGTHLGITGGDLEISDKDVAETPR